MVVLLHGAVGGWDEVAIAVAAFVVLWIAVKVAGRKPANDDEEDEELAAEDVRAAEPEESAPSKLA
jgi:flagellar biosynthesis/type III secretory pathway M-ring protein FliF/YscJ